ncbi:Phox homologous domain-containing protein [Cokeromyces recurvatus]|uniref:Phox homologous domain-containing protein n=1 Tax=Cokeromyces recurvatus TaxID=90255 RepID=UPI00221EB641|nr:Phox homologous domain-containing protein [Cokeromyces recurvatus]KAI7900939.1 Phox homologous domain-containing protein [Cokeromyces recurvatus]
MKVSTLNTNTNNTIEERKGIPDSFIEIEVKAPQTHGKGFNMYTDYEIVCKTNLPMFHFKESTVRRRYSKFESLKFKLEENDYEIKVPNLPGKVLTNRFSDKIIEERRQKLEKFLQM